jgi:hypothetical protein
MLKSVSWDGGFPRSSEGELNISMTCYRPRSFSRLMLRYGSVLLLSMKMIIQYGGLRPPWRWKKRISFERQQLFTVRHGVLWRYTWTFLNTVVRPPVVSQYRGVEIFQKFRVSISQALRPWSGGSSVMGPTNLSSHCFLAPRICTRGLFCVPSPVANGP